MPLLNNYEVWEMPETGEISRETLRAKFPEYYNEKKPITVHALDHLFTKVKRVQEGTNIPMGVVRKAPEPKGYKASANIIVDGKQVALQYSDSMPIVGAFNKTFPPSGNRVQLKHGMTIREGQEDVLFFLYFGLDVFKNGYAPSRLPSFEFYKPEAKAADTISEWKKKQALENLVYNTLTTEQVATVMTGLNLELQKTDDMNRMALVGAVRAGNDLFKKLFYELTESSSKEKKEVAVDPSEIVDKQIEAGQIKDEGGKWYSMSKVKAGEWNKTPFYDTKEENADNSRLSLIEHLKTNDVLLNKINS
jgi:hypothetical protein